MGGLDCLVIAVSTTGTILRVARRLREKFPKLRVIAVDAVGSVIFGAPSAPRELPGIGSSRGGANRADWRGAVVYLSLIYLNST